MWINPKDVCPQGDPETVVILPSGSILGLHILGVTGTVMLGIREDRDGCPVSCAVTTEFCIDTGVPAQRNHNRTGETGE